MASVKQINQSIEDGTTLQSIADAFSEISSLKLKRIRGGIVRNKQFSQELTGILGILRKLAVEEKSLSKLVDKLIEKNSKTVTVVVTSNHKFYGGLTSKLIDLFIRGTANMEADRIVIGTNGVDYLKAKRVNFPYKVVEFKEDLPTAPELQSLIQAIYPYKKIVFFHSNFKTVLSQVPLFTELTGDSSVMLSNITDPKKASSIGNQGFILEPELEKILTFFDSQILTLLVESIFLEEELSRTASRLLSMGGAQDNALNYIKEQKKLLFQAKRSVSNNRLLETYTTFSLWKGAS